jgi:hypothetical protein
MTQALTFRGWLQLQADRDDPIGDLARDAFRGGETGCPRGCRFTTWPAFARHLTEHHPDAPPAVWAATRTAQREFLRYANRRGGDPSRSNRKATAC